MMPRQHLRTLVGVIVARLGVVPEPPAAVAPARLAEGPLPNVSAAYPTLRREYRSIIESAVAGYLESSGGVRRWRNITGRAVLDYFAKAFHRGLADAGAEELDEEDARWLTTRMNAELGFVNAMFAGLKEKRTAGVEPTTEAAVRAEGYAATLDGVYQEGQLRAKKSRMLTWHYGDADHCGTCSSLNGQRHRASWYLKRNYIPRKPGAAMDCGGYQCKCWLADDSGNVVTILA